MHAKYCSEYVDSVRANILIYTLCHCRYHILIANSHWNTACSKIFQVWDPLFWGFLANFSSKSFGKKLWALDSMKFYLKYDRKWNVFIRASFHYFWTNRGAMIIHLIWGIQIGLQIVFFSHLRRLNFALKICEYTKKA